MKQDYVGVLDCNNFFVSCERLFRPDLWKRPVIVLSSNDGCVVARSKEVKDLGIPMGVPHFQVKDLIKNENITVFSSNFPLYRNISRRIFSLLEKEVDQLRIYSIDEAFFALNNVTEAEAEIFINSLKEKLEKAVGIPLAIGLAQNKTLAKYANSLAKKQNGVKILSLEEWTELSTTVSLNQIWGVGGRLAVRYREAGLSTVSQLVKADKNFIQARFGVVGLRLQAELKGELVNKIDTKSEEQKSLTHSRSTKTALFKKPDVISALAHHVEKAAATLRRHKLLAGNIQVFAYPSRYRGGQYINLSVPVTIPTNDDKVLLKIMAAVVEKQYLPENGYKKIGITCTELLPESYLPRSLFSDPKEVVENTNLLKTIDLLNQRFGENTIHRAITLNQSWRPNSSWRSPSYVSSWRDLPKATT